MAKSIKVAVLTNAEGAHLGAYFPALAQTEEAELVVLADPSGRTAAQAKKALGTKLKATYRDTAELLEKEQPQMVLVSVEARLAPPLIDKALDAGCHVFCEKPSCVRVEDFAPLVRKAQQKHRHLMLALANRVHAPVREARRIIRDGLLGKIYAIEVHLVADQTRLKREAYRKEWYCIKGRAGGGNLIWLGIHWLDLALFITGLKVKQAAGFAGVVGGQPLDIEDSAAVALRFDNGTFGTMTAGYYLDKGYQSHLQVWGEHGWLRLASFEDLPLEWYSTKEAKEAKVQRFEYEKGKRGYTPFVRAAVRASAGLEEAPITGEECLHVLKTVFAFYRAAQTGRTQEV
ncbi:MAG TPA: Gfo/Idh/MocA family oxidoreductase [Gemmataceae bacterium]|nr:Gfo/Idh/MocA family oxidoreductase [Gemmataceae bacterium]